MGRFACLGMSASPACAVEIVAEMSLGCVGKIRAFSVHESRVVDCWPFFFLAVIHRVSAVLQLMFLSQISKKYPRLPPHFAVKQMSCFCLIPGGSLHCLGYSGCTWLHLFRLQLRSFLTMERCCFCFLTSSDLSFFLKWLLVVKSRCTPLKSNIDTRNSHVWSRAYIVQGPSFLVSMLDFGGVFSGKWVCELWELRLLNLAWGYHCHCWIDISLQAGYRLLSSQVFGKHRFHFSSIFSCSIFCLPNWRSKFPTWHISGEDFPPRLPF